MSLLSIASNALTVLTFLVGGFALGWPAGPPAAIFSGYVCALATALLLALFVRESRDRRQSRYAASLVPLNRAFASLSDASHAAAGDAETRRLHVQRALGHLAEAFSLITQTPCRATVKRVVPCRSANCLDVPVETFCRSRAESGPPAPAGGDRIGNNTDFRELYQGVRGYWFCNDLPAELARGYQNSHWDAETVRAQRFGYRSTVVWPIRRDGGPVVGFLCVDSGLTGVFHEIFDVPLGEAFAAVLRLAMPG